MATINGVDPVSNPNSDYFRPPGCAVVHTQWTIRSTGQSDLRALLNTKYEITDSLALSLLVRFGQVLLQEDGGWLSVEGDKYNFSDNDKSLPDLRITTTRRALNSDRRLFFDERIFNINGLPLFMDIDANADGVSITSIVKRHPHRLQFQNQFHHTRPVAVYTDDSYKISSADPSWRLRFTHDKGHVDRS